MAVFTNRAMLSYNGGTTASNTVTGELLGALSVTKTALAGSYAAGDTVTYAISLINSGDSDITDLTLTDDLGAFSTEGVSVTPLTYIAGSAALFEDGVPMGAPSVTAGDTLVFSGITVPAEGNALIIYEAEINRFAPLETGSSITNTATAESPDVGSPVRGSETLGVSNEPELSVTKAMSPLTVMENGSLTYTFTIENSGCTAAGADAELVLSDAFSPILSGLSVKLDGAPLSAPTGYTYDELTGEFATVSGVITVPAAVFTHNADGSVGVTPGSASLTVSGTVQGMN